MGNIETVKHCRVCGSTALSGIVDLGQQCYTGRFPDANSDDPPRIDLAIIRCEECNLVQLKHFHASEEMYGANYAYRSSITQTMKTHLNEIRELALQWFPVVAHNLKLRVLDIGSNDGTLLSYFSQDTSQLVGIDPCAMKHVESYPQTATVISDFFSTEAVRRESALESFDIVTSIAMFYDLDDPVGFARQVASLLSEQGVWITEQTHSHALIESNCYDSICHEHATYLSFSNVVDICNRAELKIVDVKTNEINGGSFALVIAKKDSNLTPNDRAIEQFRQKEALLGLERVEVWDAFRSQVLAHRIVFRDCLDRLRAEGESVCGYGASTKGNVLLQYCGITPELMPVILERDSRKYGYLTPGTRIPIISESEGRSMNPDVLVVFPWHFRQEIIKREHEFLNRGGKLLFPLPKLSLVSSENLWN